MSQKYMVQKKINKWNIFILLSFISIFHYNWDFQKYQTNTDQPSVILSSNFNLRYLFLLPFTVTFWKRLGVKSVIIFVGSEKEFLMNHQSREAIEMLKELNSTIMYFQPIRLSTTSLSQIVRLFGAVLPLPNIDDESILITSDADLAVLKLSNHIPNLNNHKKIHLYNSDCCGTIKVPPKNGRFQVKMFPMGTIGATKKIWREIMGFEKATKFSISTLEKYVIDKFGRNFFHPTDDRNLTIVGSRIWYADQSLFSYKFYLWKEKYFNKRFISYHPNSPKRIDRMQWPTSKNFSELKIENFDDIHLPISAYSKKEWKHFLPFLKFTFTNEPLLIERFKSYRETFCKYIIC